MGNRGPHILGHIKRLPALSVRFFWSPLWVQKTFCGDTLIKQQVWGLNALRGDLSLFMCPNSVILWAAALQNLSLWSTQHVFLTSWEWYTCKSFALYPGLYFKACFFSSPDTGNLLWFLSGLKGLMAWHRTKSLEMHPNQLQLQQQRNAGSSCSEGQKLCPWWSVPRSVFGFQVKRIY